MGITPNVDDVVSGRPGRSGNWAASLGGPKAIRLFPFAASAKRNDPHVLQLSLIVAVAEVNFR
jgi:hypothetical protein